MGRRWLPQTMVLVSVTIAASIAGPLVVPSLGASAATAFDPTGIVASEAAYVASAQITQCPGTPLQGAITLNALSQSDPTALAIEPYQANYGVQALIAAGGADLALAKDWLGWYVAHANWPDYNGLYGTVYDYTANVETCTMTAVTEDGHPRYDSTDAYAGTWLSAIKAYARADTADWGWIRSPYIADWLNQEAHMSVATLQGNGLTGARPDYPAEYLMDNAQVLQGLRDYEWIIENVLGSPRKAVYWQGVISRISTGITQALFRPVGQIAGAAPQYGSATDQLSPSWSECYPSATAQLWTVLDGVGPLARQAATWAQYKASYPGWLDTTPSYPDISCPLHDTESAAAYAAALAGDSTSALDWLASSDATWVAAGRPYPWTVQDSGLRALTAEAA